MSRAESPLLGRGSGLVALFVASILVNLVLMVWLARPDAEPGDGDLSVADVASDLRFEVERRALVQETRLNVALETTSGVSVLVPGDEARIVTDVLVEAESVVSPGSQLVRLNGRPIWALPLAFPLYRDIEPGTSGDDIAELQRGLNTMSSELDLVVDGEYGPSTQEAVEGLYRSFGVEPDRVTAEDVGLPQVTAEVEQLERDVRGLIEQGDASEQDKASAQQRLESARGAQASAVAKMGIVVRRGDVVPLDEGINVVDVSVAVGQNVSGGDSLLVAGQSRILGLATLTEDQAKGMAIGQEVSPDDAALPAGTIVDVAREDGSSSVTARVDFGPIPGEPPPQSVGATMSRDLTEGPVLALPVSVVFVDASGRRVVRVPDGESDWREIEVVTGVVGGGFVELTDGPLEEGDVVLGG